MSELDSLEVERWFIGDANRRPASITPQARRFFLVGIERARESNRSIRAAQNRMKKKAVTLPTFQLPE